MRYRIKGVAEKTGAEKNFTIEAESEKAAATAAKQQGVFPYSVQPIVEQPVAREPSKPTRPRPATTPTTRRRPLLLRCPACSKQFSETAPACPKCGHVIDESTRSRLVSAVVRQKQAAAAVGLVVTVVFVTLFLSCVMIISTATRNGSRPPSGSIYRETDRLHQEYDSRMNRLRDIADETLNDPYITDQEFERRLREIRDIPEDF